MLKESLNVDNIFEIQHLETKLVPIEFVNDKIDFYPREKYSESSVNQYRHNIDAMPPITVTEDDYRAIAEKYFNKKIGNDEMVHHIDGNHENNAPENLVIMKKRQHSKGHALFNSGSLSGSKPICWNCLYVRLYDTIGPESAKHIITKIMPLVDPNESGAILLGYLESMAFKEENKHDCYLGKNLRVLRCYQ